MKYKVGDKVRIQPLEWYQKEIESEDCFNIFDIFWCSREMTISKIEKSKYLMKEDGQEFYWTDEMIEGLVEEEVGLVDKLSSRWVNEFNLPDGYIFKDENGNVINATKIVLEKKSKWPRKYAECCVILGVREFVSAPYDKRIKEQYPQEVNILNLLHDMRRLLICRDAYWKLAGDWKPDYDSGVDKFGIVCYDGIVTKTSAVQHWERHLNKILDFPTEEMRDAFYENFKELIEQCKELL